MDNIKVAIHRLQDSISAEKRKEKEVEDALMRLHSTANLLKLSTIPPNTFKRLSELLRQRLLPLYKVSLMPSLQYLASVLEFIQCDKLISALNARDEPMQRLWEQLLTSLLSGMLDYLDQSPDTQSRELIAAVLYPILGRIYFSPSAMFLSKFNDGLLSAAYQLLVTTVEPQARNANRLRNHGINSKSLGLTLSQIRDFLSIESLLDIICILIPPIKSGLEKRSQFIKEVFDPNLFQCSKSVLRILESITDGDWSITAIKIIEALASSDISFPQPFVVSSLMICGISVHATPPLYIDKNGFLANLDQDGKLETLRVPFYTITRVVGSLINDAEISIALVLTMPPIIGVEPIRIPSGRRLSVSWRLKKSQLDKFAHVAKDRNLIFRNLTTRKLSIPGTPVELSLPAEKQPQELISTEEKIHDMAKLLSMPSSPGPPDRTELNSPINRQSPCEEKVEDIISSTKLATAITEDEDDPHPMHSVFLDRSGNLSFTDPSYPVSHPVHEASIEQSLGDNTAASSTSGLPQRPAQQFAKNQNDGAAVASRVIHPDNTAPQAVQKRPVGRPRKTSTRTKKPPAVKRHANLEFPQTTILDTQGHSAAPIDVDKFPDLTETIPLLKTQKRRLAAAGTGTTDRAVTKPLHEPVQFEDGSLQINISPVGLKSKSEKRSSRNMEDNEAIHVADQERSTKRIRIEPSHPALPYQRKKYGRNARTSSPRAEPPEIPAIDFDEIPAPKPTGVVERLKPRGSAMNAKRVGKKSEPKPAAPKTRKQEVQSTAPKIPVSLEKAKRDNQAKESLSKIDHYSVKQGTTTTEMKLESYSTSSAKPPITTQGHHEHNARKKIEMAPWEDENFLQKAEGALDSIRLPSAKEILVQKDETWDHDQTVTLLVDDEDSKEEEELPSTSVPDIVMVDLTTPENPRMPTKIFGRSALGEDVPMANVQPALPRRQNQKVEVEALLSQSPLPTKDRRNHRSSVSFALPIESQRYSWTETWTPARKQRASLNFKSHKIRKSWEKSNQVTSMGVHQPRYLKVEEKKYEQHEEPIGKIAETINQISEVVVRQISRRFDSVRHDLHTGHQSILQGTLEHLERMHEESTTHLANMVELEEEYALKCDDILKGFDEIRERTKNVCCCVDNIVKEHKEGKKLPPTLFGKRTGILLNATIV